MPDLRLPRLPDRAPVKLTISLTPALHADLEHYAGLYNETYAAAEPLAELIPAMLGTFLQGDRAFVQRRKRKRP